MGGEALSETDYRPFSHCCCLVSRDPRPVDPGPVSGTEVEEADGTVPVVDERGVLPGHRGVREEEVTSPALPLPADHGGRFVAHLHHFHQVSLLVHLEAEVSLPRGLVRGPAGEREPLLAKWVGRDGGGGWGLFGRRAVCLPNECHLLLLGGCLGQGRVGDCAGSGTAALLLEDGVDAPGLGLQRQRSDSVSVE